MTIDLPSSESHARRQRALASALGPLADVLGDHRVVEVMLNADGVVWIERLGEGLLQTPVTMAAPEAERLLRLVAAEMLLELHAQRPSLSAKLPPPWSARLQAAIPPIVDAPVFALRKPARFIFSLDAYVRAGIVTPAQCCRASGTAENGAARRWNGSGCGAMGVGSGLCRLLLVAARLAA